MLILAQLEYYVGLGRIRIKPTITRRVVILKHDHRVLSFRHLKIGGALVKPERISGSAVYLCAVTVLLVDRISMYRYKQVGIRLIGDIGTLLKLFEVIAAAGIHHLHILMALFYHVAKLQSHTQVDALLIGFLAYGAEIMTTVTGVNDHHKVFARRKKTGKHDENR